LTLYGSLTESGTYEFLAEILTDDPRGGRRNYTALDDPHTVADQVAARPGALGFMSFSYYQANRARLRAVQVNGGAGCITPTEQAIRTGRYTPLSRPLLLYVNADALRRPAVRAYLDFYWDSAPELANLLGFVPLGETSYAANRSRIERALAGR
jgi:phosphate transport system substrate-binding protein